jgi:2-polyprenyl-3-methyl-5-hydroxy-6-metoxy-1,4-benzoquinol methylase
MPAKQTWDPDQSSEHGHFVSDLGMQVVQLLAPRSEVRVLDLGCGGALTEQHAKLSCQVTGIVASPEIIAAPSRWLNCAALCTMYA